MVEYSEDSEQLGCFEVSSSYDLDERSEKQGEVDESKMRCGSNVAKMSWWTDMSAWWGRRKGQTYSFVLFFENCGQAPGFWLGQQSMSITKTRKAWNMECWSEQSAWTW